MKNTRVAEARYHIIDIVMYPLISDLENHAVRNENRVKLGSLLSEIGRELESVDIEIERDCTSAKPMSFE